MMASVEVDAGELTAAEATQYDRQIRLWGVDAQKKMRASRVLVAGMRALSAEVCKNIVLAGVGEVVLCDHTVATKGDILGQFLISHDDIGKNRAESSIARLQELNPHVKMRADTSDISDKPDEFFLDFDIIVLTGAPLSTIKRVDSICRTHGRKFFAGDVLGYYGFFFADLGKHHYVFEKTIPPASKDQEATTEMTEETVEFVSWPQACSRDWSEAAKDLRLTSWLYFAFQVLYEYREQHGRFPAPGSEEDMRNLVEAKNAFMQNKGLDPHKYVTDDKMRSLAGGVVGGLSYVSAVVGGVLAQEILKVASAKGKPHDNFFFFDGHENAGTVERHA